MMENVLNVLTIVINVQMKILVKDVKLTSIFMKDLVDKNVQRKWLVTKVNAFFVQVTVMHVNHLKNVLHVRKEPLIMMENVINVTQIVTNVILKIHVTDVKMTSIFMKENVHNNVQSK